MGRLSQKDARLASGHQEMAMKKEYEATNIACESDPRSPESLAERLAVILNRLDQIEGTSNTLANWVIGPRPIEDDCCRSTEPNLESLISGIEDKVRNIDQVVSGLLYRVSGSE